MSTAICNIWEQVFTQNIVLRFRLRHKVYAKCWRRTTLESHVCTCGASCRQCRLCCVSRYGSLGLFVDSSVLIRGACSSHNPRPPQPQRPWICTTIRLVRQPNKSGVKKKHSGRYEIDHTATVAHLHREVNTFPSLINMLMWARAVLGVLHVASLFWRRKGKRGQHFGTFNKTPIYWRAGATDLVENIDLFPQRSKTPGPGYR